MHNLRPYQIEIADKGLNVLKRKGFVYLNLECRVGKTCISLETAKLAGAKKVLFITKLKAIKSIENDYRDFGHTFSLTVINKESIHKILDNDFDLIICDEAHSLFATFPKPNQFIKIYRKRFWNVPSILLSATMSPEGYSQIFHQFWINRFAPFNRYVSFYNWAKDFVTVGKKHVGTGQTINDYSNANWSKISPIILPFVISYTQQAAGFTHTIIENVLTVKMKPSTYRMIKAISTDGIYEGNTDVILADTGVKMQSKVHQLCGGTVICEGETRQTDDTKVRAIIQKFKGKKIAIFTVYKKESEMIRSMMPSWTDNPEVFNTDKKATYVGQIRSSREGVNLSSADCLIYYNLEFSALSYLQGRDRATSKDRVTPPEVWFIMADKGIEIEIYKKVKTKESFTQKHFEQWKKKSQKLAV